MEYSISVDYSSKSVKINSFYFILPNKDSTVLVWEDNVGDKRINSKLANIAFSAAKGKLAKFYSPVTW